MAVDKWAANLSFLFKEFPPFERFEAASRNGKGEPVVLVIVLQTYYGVGFKGVEFGPDVTHSCSKEELVSAKERAGVEVVGLVGQNGELKITLQNLFFFGYVGYKLYGGV